MRFGALALVAVLALAGSAMANESPPEPGDTAVARVEGEVVWASDVRREAVAQGLVADGAPLSLTSDTFLRVREAVIDQKLLAREARRRGLDRDPEVARVVAAANERALGDALIVNVVDDAVDESDIQALYDEQLRVSRTGEEIRARLILVKTRAEAETVWALLANGASFAALASQRSIDADTRSRGGDLGYFTLDVMPETYGEALAEAKAGSTVGPIETEGGWAVLRVEDRRSEPAPTLETARPQILRFLTYDAVRNLLEELRTGANIEMLTPESP